MMNTKHEDFIHFIRESFELIQPNERCGFHIVSNTCLHYLILILYLCLSWHIFKFAARET